MKRLALLTFLLFGYNSFLRAQCTEFYIGSFPEDITIECGSEIPSFDYNITSSCGLVTWSMNEDIVDDNGCSYTLVRTVEYTNPCGHVCTQIHVISVVDTTTPYFESFPADIYVALGEEIPSDFPTAYDNCSEVIIAHTDFVQENLCGYTIYRDFTASDVCNNTTYASQIIHVDDSGYATCISADFAYMIPPFGSEWYFTITGIGNNYYYSGSLPFSQPLSIDPLASYVLEFQINPSEIGNGFPFSLQIPSFNWSTYGFIGANGPFFFPFQVGGFGCTDPAAGNYEPLATINNGSCCYNSIYGFVMTDLFGDGWNGATYNVTDANGDTVVSGTLPNGNFGTVDWCLPDGCYHLNISGGDFPGEIGWTLFDPQGQMFLSGDAPFSTDFSVGGACGCTDPLACNFQPNALLDDGSCNYNCVRVDFDGIPPLGEIWGFQVTGISDNFFQSETMPYSGDFALHPFTEYIVDMSSNGNSGWMGNYLTFLKPEWNWSFSTTLSPNGPWQKIFKTGGPGCTDPIACNYNPEATINDGTCEYTGGCTDPYACNYNPDALCDDGTCLNLYGCTSPDHLGYNPASECLAYGCITCPEENRIYLHTHNMGGGSGNFIAVYDLYDNLITWYPVYDASGNEIPGIVTTCIDPCAVWKVVTYSYEPEGTPLPDPSWHFTNANLDIIIYGEGTNEVSEIHFSPNVYRGCTDPEACNYHPLNVCGDAPCFYTSGCTQPYACNFDPYAYCDDGSCTYLGGCTDPEALNYNSSITCDDGSCVYPQVLSCPADLNLDGLVAITDLLMFVSAFGTECGQ